MINILCSDVNPFYLNLLTLSVQNSKIFHVKMLNNEETIPFPHYLVVHHCNANDFELGEDFHCPLLIIII